MSEANTPTPNDVPARRAKTRRPTATALEIMLPIEQHPLVEQLARRGRGTIIVTRVAWRVQCSHIDGLPVWSVTCHGHYLDAWGERGAPGAVCFRPPAGVELPASPAAAHLERAPSWVPVPDAWLALARNLITTTEEISS